MCLEDHPYKIGTGQHWVISHVCPNLGQSREWLAVVQTRRELTVKQCPKHLSHLAYHIPTIDDKKCQSTNSSRPSEVVRCEPGEWWPLKGLSPDCKVGETLSKKRGRFQPHTCRDVVSETSSRAMFHCPKSLIAGSARRCEPISVRNKGAGMIRDKLFKTSKVGFLAWTFAWSTSSCKYSAASYVWVLVLPSKK